MLTLSPVEGITIAAPTEPGGGEAFSIQLPASKSISNRVLIIRALTAGQASSSPSPSGEGRGEAEILNLSECEDTQVLQKALSTNNDTIDLKASGTALRFLTAYYAVTPGTHRLTGCRRLMERPMAPLIDALRQLGATIDTCDEYIVVHGSRLAGGRVELRGDISSQFVSALLLIGPTLPLGLQIDLIGHPVSRPYIELTLHLMRTFGIDARFVSESRLFVPPGKYQSKPFDWAQSKPFDWAQSKPFDWAQDKPFDWAQDKPFVVEADWSAASYWYAMMGLDERLQFRFPGLLPDSVQGDRIIVELIHHKSGLLVHDFADTPDIVPTMAVYCVLKGLHFEFTGLQGLRLKETDRLTALRTELAKWGYRVSATSSMVGEHVESMVGEHVESTLCWHGERCEASDKPIETYGDHRMAMAFAIGAVQRKTVRIAHPEVVGKSYPRFWDDLRRCGFIIE